MRPRGSATQRVTVNGITRSVAKWLAVYGISWRRGRALLDAGHTIAAIIAMEHPQRRRTLTAAERREKQLTRKLARRMAACERALAALRQVHAEIDSAADLERFQQ